MQQRRIILFFEPKEFMTLLIRLYIASKNYLYIHIYLRRKLYIRVTATVLRVLKLNDINLCNCKQLCKCSLDNSGVNNGYIIFQAAIIQKISCE